MHSGRSEGVRQSWACLLRGGNVTVVPTTCPIKDRHLLLAQVWTHAQWGCDPYPRDVEIHEYLVNVGHVVASTTVLERTAAGVLRNA